MEIVIRLTLISILTIGPALAQQASSEAGGAASTQAGTEAGSESGGPREGYPIAPSGPGKYVPTPTGMRFVPDAVVPSPSIAPKPQGQIVHKKVTRTEVREYK